MREFLTTFPRHLVASYRGKFVYFHLLAILSTAVIVLSGFDWFYFVHTQTTLVRTISFIGVMLGSFVPTIFSVCIIVIGWMRRDRALTLKGWIVGQAALIGLIISSVYKAFTGRVQPPYDMLVDISREFQFGLWRHGIFWGWPSSHTTTSFAFAFAFFVIFSESKWKWLVIFYAFFVGLGVSTTIHWFSEFVAGALIGAAIGLSVGKSFKRRS